jgi:hypothetical protein
MANKPPDGPDIEVDPLEEAISPKKTWWRKFIPKPRAVSIEGVLPEGKKPRKRWRWFWLVVPAVAIFILGLVGSGLFWMAGAKPNVALGGRPSVGPGPTSPGENGDPASPTDPKSNQGGPKVIAEQKAVQPTAQGSSATAVTPSFAQPSLSSASGKGGQPEPAETLEKYIAERDATGTQKQNTERARLEADLQKFQLESTKARLLKEQFEKNPGMVLESAGGMAGTGAFRTPPAGAVVGSRDGQPGQAEKPGLLQPEGPGPLVRVTQETPEGREALVLINDRLSVVREGENVGPYMVKAITTNGVTFTDKAGRVVYRPLAAVRSPDEGRGQQGGPVASGPPSIPASVGPPQPPGPYEEQPPTMSSPVPHGAPGQNPQGPPQGGRY